MNAETCIPLLLDASAAAESSAAQLGGKAWQLARLRRFGLPVPDFLVIPAAWSRTRHEGEEALAALRPLLAEALAARGWSDMALAVRSSAVGEDGAEASFAGIYRSCLNVRGVEAVARAVAQVWASLDSAAAKAYRARLGHGGEAHMAVLLMPLLPARAAGIAFTCDPISGRGDRLVVHAHWGLGDILVGGEAAGDEYVFVEDSTDLWRLQHYRAGSKARMTVAAEEGGTTPVPVPAAQAAARVLDVAQAEELANLARDAAVALEFIDASFDLEWAWDGSRFWLLQARPITAKPYCTYPELRGQPVLWTRGNTCEVVPEPLSAAEWSVSRHGVNDLLEQGWALCGYPLEPGVQRAGLFHGRLYLEASVLQWEAWDCIGLSPASMNALMGGHQPAIPVPPPRLRERLARLGRVLRYALLAPGCRRRGMAAVARVRAAARAARHAPLPQDAAGLRRELMARARPAREEKEMLFLQGSGGGALSMLVETLEKAIPGEGAGLAAALLAGGEPSVTARQGYELLALARLARDCGALDGGEGSAAFQAAFARFLDEYGHRGHYETYYRNPRLREQPEVLRAQLKTLAEVDEAALRQRQQEGRARAWQQLRQHLPAWKRAWVAGLAKAANRECNQREAARSALIACLDAGREALLAAGRLAVAQGALRVPEDVFLLMASEIRRYLAGDIPAAGLHARVLEREAQFQRWQTEQAPDYLSLGPAPAQVAAAAPAEAPASPRARERWQGVATGTGTGRGRVRILRHPAEGARLQPGEILVAPSTDPGWTPLFLQAAGLVVETGGYLSHGAIVAREFALPAVVNLPGILDSLRDGDLVEIDGLRGEVRRLQAA